MIRFCFSSPFTVARAIGLFLCLLFGGSAMGSASDDTGQTSARSGEASAQMGQPVYTPEQDSILQEQQLQTLRSFQQLLPEYPDSAISLIHAYTSLNDPESLPDLTPAATGRAHYLLGLAYYFKDYYRAAVHHFELGLHYYSELNDAEMMLALWNNIGINHDILGQWDDSMNAYAAAIELATAKADTFSLAQIELNLGLVSKNLGFLDRARSYTEQALQIFEEQGDLYHQGLAHLNIGLIHIEAQQTNLAPGRIRQAYDLFEQTGNYFMAARALNNLAYFYLDHHTLSPEFLNLSALYLEQSRQIHLEHLGGTKAPRLQIMFMTLHVLRTEYSTALELLDELHNQQIYNDLSSDLLNVIVENAAQIHAFSGDSDALRAVISEVNAARQARTEREALRTLAETEVLENMSVLRHTLETQQARMAVQQRRFIAVSLALLAIVSLLLYILYTRRELRTTRVAYVANAMLDEENRLKSDFESVHEFRHATKDDYFRKICDLIETEEVYLTSNVKLEDIAKKLNTNTKYISKAINDNTNLNFNKFINLYRVNRAKEIISETVGTHNYADIARKVGFSNETTFYRNFKEFTNQTPTEFKQTTRYHQNPSHRAYN